MQEQVAVALGLGLIAGVTAGACAMAARDLRDEPEGRADEVEKAGAKRVAAKTPMEHLVETLGLDEVRKAMSKAYERIERLESSRRSMSSAITRLDEGVHGLEQLSKEHKRSMMATDNALERLELRVSTLEEGAR